MRGYTLIVLAIMGKRHNSGTPSPLRTVCVLSEHCPNGDVARECTHMGCAHEFHKTCVNGVCTCTANQLICNDASHCQASSLTCSRTWHCVDNVCRCGGNWG